MGMEKLCWESQSEKTLLQKDQGTNHVERRGRRQTAFFPKSFIFQLSTQLKILNYRRETLFPRWSLEKRSMLRRLSREVFNDSDPENNGLGKHPEEVSTFETWSQNHGGIDNWQLIKVNTHAWVLDERCWRACIWRVRFIVERLSGLGIHVVSGSILGEVSRRGREATAGRRGRCKNDEGSRWDPLALGPWLPHSTEGA